MPPPERDHVAREHEVVANQHAEAGRDLKRKRLIVCRPDANRRGELPSLAPRKINDSEEQRSIPLDCVRLLANRKGSTIQFSFDGVYQLAVSNGFPCTCCYRSFDCAEHLAIDADCSAVSEQCSDHGDTSRFWVGSLTDSTA